MNETTLPSNRKFGLFFSLVFLLIGFYLYIFISQNIGFLLFAASISFFLISIFKPYLLFNLNKGWSKFGYFLGRVFNPIILGLLFFGIFTPLSLLMRSFGRDELQLKVVNKTSLWKNRKSENMYSNSYKNQY